MALRIAPSGLFRPILAGATFRDRLVASVGAMIGLSVTALLSRAMPATGEGLPVLLAPIGASAVLLFAVPASPLAQPWPIFGGNIVSAVVGLLVGHWVGYGPVAIGVAVGAAILTMSLLRCLHPPGGALAMTAVIGGPAIWAAGASFAFGHVAANSAAVIAVGWAFHRLSGHSYPHRPASGAQVAAAGRLHRDDIRRALAESGEAFDVAASDLELLLTRAEHYAEARRQAPAAAEAP